MGLFSILESTLSATVKIALTPIAVIKDAKTAMDGNNPTVTKDLVKSAAEDVNDALNDLFS